METSFHIYDDKKNKHKHDDASIFDLISGNDNEPKQTKGLAYIFYHYPEFLLKYFLEIKAIKTEIKLKVRNFKIKEIETVEIDAENISDNGDRPDIVIKFLKRNAVLLVLIIEAKSIKKNIKQKYLFEQINKYLNDDSIADQKSFKKGIVLTKYRQIIPDIISITWDDIIEKIDSFCKSKKSDNKIIKQYYYFLTKIGGSMKFYEKEIVSIPAGASLELIEEFGIYSCSASCQYANTKKSLYMTFRKKGGGEMSRLYKLDDVITFNPDDSNDVSRLYESDLDQNIKDRIKSYLPRIKEKNFKEEGKRSYFIFLQNNYIDLPNKPKPKNKPNVSVIYYDLKDILENDFVEPSTSE